MKTQWQVSGLVLNREVILPKFRHSERQGEAPYFEKFFAALAARNVIERIHRLPADVAFEGAGDCLWDASRQRFWFGWGQRSDREAAGYVGAIFGKPVTALELVDPRFYHLDVGLCPLGRGHILYYPAAFSDVAADAIAA